MSGGLVSVNPVDVPAAMRAGWQVLAGQNLPSVLVVPMRIPTNTAAWSGVAFTDFPDGTSTTVTAGVANIPAPWVNFALQLGWTFA